MILAYCATYYQLFNMIQLKLTLLKNESVDLILSEDSNFDTCITRLEESNLFHSIRSSKIKNVLWSMNFFKLNISARKSWFLDAVSKNTDTIPDAPYSDFYMGLDDVYNKYIYYTLVQRGLSPRIHLFEEGTASYVLPFSERSNIGGVPDDYFGVKSFYQNIWELLLYAPKLCAYNNGFQVNAIPMVNREDATIKIIFNSIFPCKPLGKQKYIYFEGGCFQDYMPTMDIEILDKISILVGRENILVKLHPRSTNDRFTRRGYSVMETEQVPWEIYALNENLESKIFLSSSSTAALSARLIFGMTTKSINLYRLDILEQTLYTRQPTFNKAYKLQEELFNAEKKTLFAPKNDNELEKILFYGV